MTETYEFIVKMRVPDNVGPKWAADYIRDAVQSWAGQFMGDDPRWGLGRKATVRPVPKKYAIEYVRRPTVGE